MLGSKEGGRLIGEIPARAGTAACKALPSCSCPFGKRSASSDLGTRSLLTGLPPYGLWACFPLAIWCPLANANGLRLLLASLQRLLPPCGGSLGRPPLRVDGEMRSLQFYSISIPTLPCARRVDNSFVCVSLAELLGVLLGAHKPEQSRHLIWTFQAANQALRHLSRGPCVLCFDVAVLMWEHNPPHAVSCTPASLRIFSYLDMQAGPFGGLLSPARLSLYISPYLCVAPGKASSSTPPGWIMSPCSVFPMCPFEHLPHCTMRSNFYVYIL